ncbi:MAG: hypothetical protein JWR85_2174 [Marmoricola sp.]|nr:hypothetical protein [Marmoricola sp.]
MDVYDDYYEIVPLHGHVDVFEHGTTTRHPGETSASWSSRAESRPANSVTG